MPTVIRYILLQVPGWILLGVLLWWAVTNGWLSLFTGVLIQALWMAKDAVLWPLAKPAYEMEGPAVGAKALVGKEGEAVTEIAQQGIVRIGGELWIAQGPVDEAIPKGCTVRITASKGLILSVVQMDKA